MIRSLVKIALLLVAGILVYNYFLGTDQEKTQSKEVFQKTGDAVRAVWNTVKSEKAKFDAGKYDKVLEQLGGAYKAVRQQAKYVDSKVLKRLDDLESRKQDLQTQLDAIQQEDQQLQQTPAPSGKKTLTKPDQQTAQKAADQAQRKLELQRSLDALIRDTDQLLREAGDK